MPTNQNFNNGLVKIQTVEGKLEQIKVSGLKNIQENDRLLNIVDRIPNKTPLKRQDIAKALRLIQLDPLVEKVNAKLTVGTIPTDNILLINIKEKIRDDT